MKKLILLTILLTIFCMSLFAKNNLPIINIYSDLEGASIYKAVGFNQRFVKIGNIKNGEISFENNQARLSTLIIPYQIRQ